MTSEAKEVNINFLCLASIGLSDLRGQIGLKQPQRPFTFSPKGMKGLQLYPRQNQRPKPTMITQDIKLIAFIMWLNMTDLLTPLKKIIIISKVMMKAKMSGGLS